MSDLPLSLTQFDYDRLDTQMRILVLTRTDEIKGLMKQTAQTIIQIGQKLIEVKEYLEHGQFRNWLAAEFDWSWDTAKRFMRVAEQFGQNQQIADFDIAPSALYLLAAPSTPDEARSIALERAAQGDRISHKLAKQIVASVKKADSKKHLPAQPAASPTAMNLEPNTKPETNLPLAQPGYELEDENTYTLGDYGTATVSEEPPFPDNTPESTSLPSVETSTCNWDRDRHGKLRYRVDINDSDVGRKIECLARDLGKLPQTIVALGVEALEILPKKEERITELILQVRTLVEQKNSREAELEQTISQLKSKVVVLEETLGQKEQTSVQLSESLRMAESTIETLEGTLVQLEERNVEESEESEMAIAKFKELLDSQQQRILSLEEKLSECRLLEVSSIPRSSNSEQECIANSQRHDSLPPPKSESKTAPDLSSNTAPHLKSLIEFFDEAASKIEKPTVQFNINGNGLLISRNSTNYKGKYPGCLNLHSDGHWLGSIDRAGKLFKSRDWQEWVLPMLEEFAANPTVIVQKQGKTTGAVPVP